MKKIAIVTDTSNMTLEEGKKAGVFVIPMPFIIDGVEYFDGIDLDGDKFYEKLLGDADIKTSQPSAGAVMDMWDKVLQDYDEIVHVPLSSGLSGSYANAVTYATAYDGKVEVVDTQRVSDPARVTIEDMLGLIKLGYSAKQIKERIEKEQDNSSVYIFMDTLKYLKKGGRITPTAAALGQILKIRPILQIHGHVLDAYAKVRSLSKAKDTIFKALEDEMDRMNVHSPSEVRLQAACSYQFAEREQWCHELEEHFPGFKVEYGDLPLNLTTHIGPGGRGAVVTKCLPELAEFDKVK